jgi:chorismate mutase
MASVIKIKRSTTPGSAPSTLSAGEIAVNIPDRLLFVGDGSSIYRIGAQYLSVANAVSTYQTKAIERAALANTNLYIATKVNTTTFNSALANTNSYIATQAIRIGLINTNLTGTNTALRTLVSDRLQVANAVATYQTKTVERAALANTNAYIATKVNTTTFNSALANTNSYVATQATRIGLVNTNLTGTNTALRTLISDRLQVANAVATYATKSNLTTSGVLAHTGRATISTNLEVSGNTSVVGLKANNSLGTSGYYLRTNGTSAYWDALPPPSKYLEVANATATYAVKSSPSTSGFFNHTGRLTVGTNLAVSGNTRISGSIIVDGDMTVEGAVTYISSSTLNVDDSMIKLSSNNAADVVDTGFYGKYVASSTAKYAGIFRDATDGIFKVFADSQTEPGTTVNVAATGYTLAQFDAIIDGGTY